MQKAIVKTVRLMKVRPSIVNQKLDIEINVVEKKVNFSDENISMLDFFYEHTDCSCIDIVSLGGLYNGGYSVTVDDEGLLKSGNIVLSYQLPLNGEEFVLELAGTVLIGKCDSIEGREDDGLYEVGLTNEEIFYIMDNLKVAMLGVTK